MEHGPVDVVIVATGAPKFDGSILAELERVTATGTIRVLDAMVLVADADGTVVGLDLEDFDADERAALGFIDTDSRGLFNAEDFATLAEGIAPGSAVIALAIEHVWAIGLTNALYAAGAEVGMSYRVPAAIVNEQFAALAGSDQ